MIQVVKPNASREELLAAVRGYCGELQERQINEQRLESELSLSLAREQRLRTVLRLPPFKYALEHALEVQANVRQMRDYDVVSEADCEVIRTALSSAPDGEQR